MSTYALVSSSSALDQSSTGANLIWNFTNLSQIGGSIDTYSTPSSEELTMYPETTSVLTITDNALSENKIFTKDVGNEVSITGLTRTDFILNYNTNNALIGTFPMAYNATNVDAVAGTLIIPSLISNTFTGTISSNVDAYGVLNMNDLGSGSYSESVTRLKSVQNLSFLVSGLFPGTATITTHGYYDSNNGNLVFRTNSVTIVVSALAINQSTSTIESLLTSSLSIQDQGLTSNYFKIKPNPVKDFLNIKTDLNDTLKSIQIIDISGREVLKVDGNNTTLSVSHLQSGLYIATITTQKGTAIQKFIKE
jgi:hypothetical protein